MSTNKTQHLGLHLWEPDDFVLREEFNENWEKLDGAGQQANDAMALAQQLSGFVTGGRNCLVEYGTYVGDGRYGYRNDTELTFSIRPDLVIVGCAGDSYAPSVMLRGCTKTTTTMGRFLNEMSWSDRGVKWYASEDAMYQRNSAGVTYYYIALGTSAE